MNRITIILIIIILIAGIFLIVANDYNLTKKADSSAFIKSYSGWAVKVVKNSISLTGNAIKMDWLPK